MSDLYWFDGLPVLVSAPGDAYWRDGLPVMAGAALVGSSGAARLVNASPVLLGGLTGGRLA